MALQNFRFLRWQELQMGYVTEGTCGLRNRQIVPSGILAWNSSDELTEIIHIFNNIILLLCLYKFLYAVHN